MAHPRARVRGVRGRMVALVLLLSLSKVFCGGAIFMVKGQLLLTAAVHSTGVGLTHGWPGAPSHATKHL